MTKPLLLDDPWESTTWEGAAKAHLIAGANLSLPEKLAWLDEINELARNLGESHRLGVARGTAQQPPQPTEVEPDCDG